jgi:hypothetical protein
MVGSRSGCACPCWKNESIPVSILYHCIIHQALCTKVVSFKHVTNVVTIKIINSIHSISLKHRLFKVHLGGLVVIVLAIGPKDCGFTPS